ncbi:MAG: YlxR family protein [Actinobacteria bacterium]|nr:YlxR family protein [Actinomycetota bacterium]
MPGPRLRLHRRRKPTPSARSAPQRTCVGCRRVAPAADLVRIARIEGGSLQVGRTLPGRGAWLCPGSPECFELALRKGGFARAFRSPIRPADVAALRSDLAGGPGDLGRNFVSGPPAARD